MSGTVHLTLRMPRKLISALDERVFQLREGERKLVGTSRSQVIQDCIAAHLGLKPVSNKTDGEIKPNKRERSQR